MMGAPNLNKTRLVCASCGFVSVFVKKPLIAECARCHCDLTPDERHKRAADALNHQSQ